MARAAVHQGIGEKAVGRSVDPMRHIGGFRGGDGDLAIGADGHALGFDPDIDLRHHLPGLGIDHGRHGIVFVGDEQVPVVGGQHELFRIFARGQVMQDFPGVGVHHLHGVAVRGADIDALEILGKGDAAWPFAGGIGLGHGQRCGVDHADGVVLFIRHPDFARLQRQGKDQGQQGKAGHGVAPKAWQSLSGASSPRLSVSLR